MTKFQNKAAGVINASDLKTWKGKLVYWSFFTILVLICVVCVVPTLWVFLSSFKETQEMYTSAAFFPKKISWDIAITRIVDALKLMDLKTTLPNTLIESIGEVVFALLFAGFGGYVLSRLKPAGTTLIFTLVVWTMLMPGQIRTVPLFISWLDFPFLGKLPGEISLLNTYWPMWLSAASNTFNIILFKNYFDSISISYVEAAKLDGCGNMGTFFYILMPLSKPVVTYVTIMTMKSAWSNFFTPYLVLTDASKMTLMVKIYQLSGNPMVKLNTYMMCLVLASVPMLIIFIIFQKNIIGGVNVGGVKG